MSTTILKNPQTRFFPQLEPFLNNGFSWKTQNMSYNFGKKEEVEKSLSDFYKINKLDASKYLINMDSQHKNRIKFIGKEILQQSSKKIFSFKCDCLITDSKEVVLLAKPADCAISIIYAESPTNQFNILLHTGRAGIDLALPRDLINFLVKKFSVDVKSIKIGISPMISKEHYFIKKRDISLLSNINAWKSFMTIKKDKIFLDLKNFLIKQFIECNIKHSQIFDSNLDTFTEAQKGNCFSHRYATMNKKNNGRMIVYSKLK
jgi:copper oxidase (laccase) domain-containing protein